MNLRIRIPVIKSTAIRAYKSAMLGRGWVNKLDEKHLIAYRRIQGQRDGTFPPRPPPRNKYN